MNREALRKAFDSFESWVTYFKIDGEIYGGHYSPKEGGDHRLDKFFDYFPVRKPNRRRRKVLELGACEGGHSIALAERGYKVTAIEGRAYNVEKAEFVKSIICPEADIKFIVENLEEFNPASLGKFDVVFCVGLLYHLPRPWELLKKLNLITNNLFLSTHYHLGHDLDRCGGYLGSTYPEHGINDPLSGLSRKSFWPTLEELERMVTDNGFRITDVLPYGDWADSPHPLATIVCKKNE